MNLVFDEQMDAEAAGKALADWVGGLGYRVKSLTATDRFSVRSRFNYTVTMAGTPEMRRIVFIAVFGGSPNHRDPDERVRFANRINVQYNVCKAAFDEEGSLYLEYVLYVERELSPSFWTTFLLKADDAISWLNQRHKAEFDEMTA
jgi:hypothetical protein